MKLVHKVGNKEIKVGDTVTICFGANKGKTVRINEIIPPGKDHPEGIVKVNDTGTSWQQYFPYVICAKWVKELG